MTIRRLAPTIARLLATVCTAAPALAIELSDPDLEAALLEGRVVEVQPIESGVTRPVKLRLEHGGQTLKAAFKNVDIKERRRYTQPGFPRALEFTDRFHYERAAYVVDRELGLGMVPVAVIRELGGKRGAVVAWISDAINELERRHQKLEPPNPRILFPQRHAMRIFDALILNTDRTQENQLITTADWKLHLIDHSRAFRLSHELPDDFLTAPVKLTHRLLARLEALDSKRLRQLLDGVLDPSRIRAMMARRDRILEKIERDRATYGDPLVFQFDFKGSPP